MLRWDLGARLLVLLECLSPLILRFAFSAIEI
jgi:hypothetical protein